MSIFARFRYGRDPRQLELAAILAQEAANEIAFGGDGLDTSAAVALFTMSQPWSEKEQARRIKHALTLLDDAPPEIRQKAQAIANRAIEKLD